MEDNWCDVCSKSRRQGHTISWYYTDDLGEVALCKRDAKELCLTFNDLVEM
jgi:hypothetical protein